MYDRFVQMNNAVKIEQDLTGDDWDAPVISERAKGIVYEQ